MTDLNAEQVLLIEEHRTATQNLRQINELKAKLVVVWLLFAVAGVGLLVYIYRGATPRAKLGFVEGYVGGFNLIIAGVAAILACVLGRLRHHQVRQNNILASIRKQLLDENLEVYRLFSTGPHALTDRFSGTYGLLSVIIVLAAFLASTATYVFFYKSYGLTDASGGRFFAFATFAGTIFLLDRVYFWSASLSK